MKTKLLQKDSILSKQQSSATIGLSILIGAILLVTAIPAVLYLPAQRFLLKPDAITEAILASDLTKQIPDWVASWMVDGSGTFQNGDTTYLASLDQQDYHEIIAQVAPSDWAVIQSAVIARQAQEFFLGNTNTLTITIDLTEVKNRLAGEALPAVAEQIVSSWENCSAGTLAELALAVASGNSPGTLPLCQPPDEFRPLALQGVESGIQQFAAQMPASVSFDVAQAATASTEARIMRFVARVWPWTPWLTIGLALFLLLTVGGSLRSGLLGFGIPLSLAGMIDAGLALVMISMRESVVTPWLAGWINSESPSEMAVLLTPALANVSSRFFLSALIWSAAAIVFGMALIILSRIARR